MAKQREQDIKAVGCLVAVVAVVVIGGCNAIFGDDSKPSAKRSPAPAAKASSQTSGPAVVHDDASLQSCWQIAYADSARIAGQKARVSLHESLAGKEARKSDDGVLRKLRKPSAVRSWCKRNWSEINVKAVGKYDSSKFGRDGQPRGGSGDGGSGDGGGINLPGRGW